MLNRATHRTPTLGRLALIVLVLAGVLSAPAVRAQPTKKDIVRLARSATVYIDVPGRGSGSGFVVDREERLVVSCAHVVGSQAEARVYFPIVRDGKLVAERKAYGETPGIPAVVIDVNPSRDLCVLRLDRLPPDAAVAPLAAESPEAGDDIFSIGNPGNSGALWIYTSGTVRQVYRKKARLGSGQLIDARTVETQAPINPGDSGGPVFNAEGKVIGVNSYFIKEAALVSACIDVTEVAGFLTSARPWLRATTPNELRSRARHYLGLKLYTRALPDLDRLVQGKPDASSYLLRADAMVQLGSVSDAPSRIYTWAITDCVQVLRLDPNSGSGYGLRGAAFLGIGALDQAVADYTDAIRLQPDTAEHYVQRGLAYSRRKETEPALKDFRKAHAIDPKAHRPQFLEARVLLDAKEYARALEAFDKVIEADPTAPASYDLRGDANVGLRRYEQAVRDYSKALELRPENFFYLTDRASALNELKRFQAAIADCDKALAIQPRHGNALYQRARAAYGLGRHAAALEDVGKALDLPVASADERQMHIDALVLSGRIHLFGLKEHEHAVTDLTRALEQDPNNPVTLNLRGIAHASRGDNDRAFMDYSAAFKLAPKNVVYLTNRGLSLLKQEKYDDAVKDFTAAIALNPNYPQAYEHRSRAYAKLDNQEKAASDTAKAAELRKVKKN